MSDWEEVRARLEEDIANLPSISEHGQDIRAALEEVEKRGKRIDVAWLEVRVQRERAERAEAEARKYHDALVARHGGEPVALLEELDEARAEVERLRSALEALTDATFAIKDLNLPYQAAITLGVKAALARLALRGER